MNQIARISSAAENIRAFPENTRPAISFAGISKRFVSAQGDTPALDNVSLDVRKGQFIALIGPSGCGKTTLLNLIAGLIPPDSGTVAYEGTEVKGPNTKVGYLTQLDALLPWRTVLGNVALPLEIRRVPKGERLEQARLIIERVGLKGFERHYPGQLSGGMKKRVAMARTLIYQPETLLLDEPFSALDAQTRIVIQRQLQELVSELGLTVLLVTHDIAEAIALADTIAVFSKRPARLLETIRVAHPQGWKFGPALRSSDAIYDQVWTLLSKEFDMAIGA
jgi:NitT/TauT family transport system ATP-binding protein